MERGKPPQRKTPLKQGAKGLARGKGLRQVSEKKAASGRTSTFKPRESSLDRSYRLRTEPIKPKPDAERAKTAKKTPPRQATRRGLPAPGEGFPESVRRQLWQRCGGLCEKCGLPMEPRGWHAHHRKRRREDDHTLDNGVALHAWCHVLTRGSVHMEPRDSQDRGLIVRANSEDDPRTTPLVLASGVVVYLHPSEPIYLDAPEASPADAALG